MREAASRPRATPSSGDAVNARAVLPWPQVTIQLASELSGAGVPIRPAGMVAANTFTCIEEMVGAAYPLLDWWWVRRYLLRMQWRSIEHVAHVTLPCLFIRGMKDEVRPAPAPPP